MRSVWCDRLRFVVDFFCEFNYLTGKRVFGLYTRKKGFTVISIILTVVKSKVGPVKNTYFVAIRMKIVISLIMVKQIKHVSSVSFDFLNVNNYDGKSDNTLHQLEGNFT